MNVMEFGIIAWELVNTTETENNDPSIANLLWTLSNLVDDYDRDVVLADVKPVSSWRIREAETHD